MSSNSRAGLGIARTRVEAQGWGRCGSGDSPGCRCRRSRGHGAAAGTVAAGAAVVTGMPLAGAQVGDRLVAADRLVATANSSRSSAPAGAAKARSSTRSLDSCRRTRLSSAAASWPMGTTSVLGPRATEPRVRPSTRHTPALAHRRGQRRMRPRNSRSWTLSSTRPRTGATCVGRAHRLRARLSTRAVRCGMRQRTASPTLAYEPRLILMDEPFGALDGQTRLTLRAEPLRIWDNTGMSILFVTHDLAEAILLAQRLLLFTRRPGPSGTSDRSTCPTRATRSRFVATRASAHWRPIYGNNCSRTIGNLSAEPRTGTRGAESRTSAAMPAPARLALVLRRVLVVAVLLASGRSSRAREDWSRGGRMGRPFYQRCASRSGINSGAARTSCCGQPADIQRWQLHKSQHARFVWQCYFNLRGQDWRRMLSASARTFRSTLAGASISTNDWHAYFGPRACTSATLPTPSSNAPTPTLSATRRRPHSIWSQIPLQHWLHKLVPFAVTPIPKEVCHIGHVLGWTLLRYHITVVRFRTSGCAVGH